MLCDGVSKFRTADLLDVGDKLCKIYWRVGVGSYVSKGETVGRVAFHEHSKEKYLTAPVSGEILSLFPTTESFERCTDTVIINIVAGECTHRIAVMGLCAQCGASVGSSNVGGNAEDACANKDHLPGMMAQYVAPGFVCNDGNLQVSEEFAVALEKERGLHLTDKRQLCLVVDLDNTLVHAFPQPPHPSLNSSLYKWNNPILRLQSHDTTAVGSLDGCPCMNLGRNTVTSRDVEVTPSSQSDCRESSKCLWDTVQVCGVDVPLALRRYQTSRKSRDMATDTSAAVDLIYDINLDPPALKRVCGPLKDSPVGRKKPIKRRRAVNFGDTAADRPQEQSDANRSPTVVTEEENRTTSEGDASKSLTEGKSESSVDAITADHQAQRDCSHPHYGDFADERVAKKIELIENNVVVVPTQSTHGDYLTYFKLRPGVLRFLSVISKSYEMYLFTMGTAQHALSALEVLDPLGLYFGNRVFSRDAVKRVAMNGVTMLGAKDISTIFPFDQKRVVVVDDTEHAWKVLESSESVLKSLIKVQGYYWFPEFRLNADGSAHLGAERPGALFRQYARQCSVGYRALMERRKKALAAEKAAAKVEVTNAEEPCGASESIELNDKSPAESDDAGNTEIVDKDTQMSTLTEMLTNLHSVYYTMHDKTPDDPNADAGIIIEAERRKVLAGVHLSATGFRQPKLNFLDTDVATWATLLGAVVTESPTDCTTHILVGAPTEKYHALRSTKCFCVHPAWLEACLFTLRRVSERYFLYGSKSCHLWTVLDGMELGELFWKGPELGEDKSDQECDWGSLEGELLESFL